MDARSSKYTINMRDRKHGKKIIPGNIRPQNIQSYTFAKSEPDIIKSTCKRRVNQQLYLPVYAMKDDHRWTKKPDLINVKVNRRQKIEETIFYNGETDTYAKRKNMNRCYVR